MAKRISAPTTRPPEGNTALPANGAPTSGPVRNSAIPRPAAAASTRTITQEQIAIRAYEIWQVDGNGSPEDHWLRAERELRGS